MPRRWSFRVLIVALAAALVSAIATRDWKFVAIGAAMLVAWIWIGRMDDRLREQRECDERDL